MSDSLDRILSVLNKYLTAAYLAVAASQASTGICLVSCLLPDLAVALQSAQAEGREVPGLIKRSRLHKRCGASGEPLNLIKSHEPQKSDG